MRYLKYAGLSATLLGVLLFTAGSAHAQVAVGVGVGPFYGAVGPEPVCAWGYYPFYPYACAPYGYWGPDYFYNGVFIGVGPWYHSHWGGYYGHGFYGRPGFDGRGGWGYGRGGYGYGYGHGGYGYRGGRGNYGGSHGYGGGGFRGGAGGGFHGGGGGHGGGHR